MSKLLNVPTCLLLLGAVSLTSGRLAAQHDAHDPHTPRAAAPAQQNAAAPSRVAAEPYLLSTDPVTGEALGPLDSQVVVEHEGRELRFANAKNAEAFRADPAKHLARVDAALADMQRARYPLTTCIVSGEKLGGMGDAVEVVAGGRLYRLCCKGCKKDIAKDEAGFRAKLDAAIVAEQRKDYPSDTCIVSGEKLGDDAIDMVLGGRLVRLCCKGCKKDLMKDPLRQFAKLDEARARKAHDAQRPEHADPHAAEPHREGGAHGEHGGREGGGRGGR